MKKITILLLFLFLFFTNMNSQAVRLADNTYIDLGNPTALQLTDFTLEVWVKIEGIGTTASTGSGGIGDIVPIISKGRAEAENATADVNFFLGYQASTNRLVADFEDQNSQNHPVFSNAILESGTWTHLAASYNSTTGTWKLYVNGQLDQTTSLGGNFIPQSNSQVKATIGTSLNTSEIPAGFFIGKIDEIRVWNTPLSDATIATYYNQEISSAANLVSRWSCNEDSGSLIGNSISTGSDGQIIGNKEWGAGFPTGSVVTPPPSNEAPDAPTDPSPSDNATISSTSPNLCVTVNDVDGDDLQVKYFGRLKSGGTTPPSSGGTATSSGTGLRFFNSNYVNVGNNSSLWLKNFSLEAWIKIEGEGSSTSTGSGGLSNAIPIITKGRAEGESPDIDVNYFFGYDASTKQLVADFEDRNSNNRRIIGNASLSNEWTHVAVTYNAGQKKWTLYINGEVDQTKSFNGNVKVQRSSDADVGIGTSFNTDDQAEGFFEGKIDEVRIWNLTRSSSQIGDNFDQELTSGNGLVGRWGFNEGSGSTAFNSASDVSHGDIIGTVDWASGFPDGTTITDPDPDPTPNTSDKFTIIWLPDTQKYSEGDVGLPEMFYTQTDWIVDNLSEKNIVYVGHLGDCVQHGDETIQWDRASTAMYELENPSTTGLAQGIPYGVCVGNNDQFPVGDPNGSTANYNAYFGVDHFSPMDYYGGHWGNNNDNHYQYFSASGIDFMVISLEFDETSGFATSGGALDWAEDLVAANPDREVIVMSHSVLQDNEDFSTQGQQIYDRLKSYSNLMMLVGGHHIGTDGEARRTDTFNGNTIHSIFSNYQSRGNGGNGRLRIFEFDPANNNISVQTYSPYTNSFETDESSQFNLTVDLSGSNGGGSTSFALIGEQNGNTSGATVCLPWNDLSTSSEYEWYVEISDGAITKTGPVWNFSTAASFALISFLPAIDLRADRLQKEVALTWQTSYENSNLGFQIQSSLDKQEWQNIGWVDGFGTSNEAQEYYFSDTRSLVGKVFYRLKQINTNGDAKYSGIANVVFSGIKIFPNPAMNQLTIAGFDLNEIEQIKMYNQFGKTVLQTQLDDNTINVSFLKQGVYILEVDLGNRKIWEKVLIVKE